jgi:hypothetical protein
LEISENKLLYITAGSFDSGGEGKVFISASNAVGEGCDPTVIPSLRTAAMLCGDQVLVVHLAGAETVVVQPSSQTDIGRPLLHQPLLPPPPKTPVTDRQTN